MKKKYLILIIISIFVVSVAVRYYPILRKGFPSGFTADNLILARNLSLAGEYKLDNEKNVVLFSGAVKENGIASKIGNKLTPIIYGEMFNVLGFDQNIPFQTAFILYGIISVLLFVLVLKLFNIKIALLFSFIEILIPIILKDVSNPGSREWAMLFLTIALLFYLLKEKPGLLKLLVVGLFLGLASLARNSFLIIPLAFAIYEFLRHKSLKRMAVLILPVIIFWGISFAPSLIKGGDVNNFYLSKQETTNLYMHIFPDPYTWHFERDAYAESVKGTSNYDYSQFLSQYGYSVSLKNKILMYWASITSYFKGLVAQTTIGGPFLLLFLILGGFYLHKNKKGLLQLFSCWSIALYVFLILAKSNNWGHFIGLQFPLALLITLGIYWIIQIILKQEIKNVLKYFLIIGFIMTVFLQLIQSNKWILHEGYLYSKIEETINMADAIKQQENSLDRKKDVISVALPDPAPQIINYYTDFSCVHFSPITIKNLLRENRLKWAFEQFKITEIIGYDRELTNEIIENTKVDVINPF